MSDGHTDGQTRRVISDGIDAVTTAMSDDRIIYTAMDLATLARDFDVEFTMRTHHRRNGLVEIIVHLSNRITGRGEGVPERMVRAFGPVTWEQHGDSWHLRSEDVGGIWLWCALKDEPR